MSADVQTSKKGHFSLMLSPIILFIKIVVRCGKIGLDIKTISLQINVLIKSKAGRLSC